MKASGAPILTERRPPLAPPVVADPAASPRELWLAATLFFASGAAALVYQVIWQRILGIVSGVHIYSVTIIVAAFMAGLGLGSLAGGRIADRLTRRRAIAGFAACEFAIGIFAWISPWLYYDVAYLRLGFLVEWPFALPVLHLGLLLPPTLLMGASLPLLARGLVPAVAGAARVIGTLYGVNTIGAALGAWVSVWWLIAKLGFVGTIRATTLLNFGAAAGAVMLARRTPEGYDIPPEPLQSAPADADHDVARPFGLATWAMIYGLSGFLALSLEILWFRVLDVSIKSSPFTFGHLLGVFLFFLGLGSFVGARIAPRVRRPDLVFLWGQMAIGFLAAGSLAIVCRLPQDSRAMAALYRYWWTDAGIGITQIREAWRAFDGLSIPDDLTLAAQVYIGFPLALLAAPTFLMGLTYPFVQRAVQTDLRQVGWRTGVIQAANIAGCMLGSLLTGTLFLTALGSPTMFRLIALAASIFGLMAIGRGVRGRIPAAVALLGCAVLMAIAVPAGRHFWARFHGSAETGVIVAEDASSVVALQRLDGSSAVLRVNGTGHSVVPPLGAHTILGAVPVLVHPAAEDVLIIGLGTGDTAWAAASAPELHREDVYEIAAPEYDVMRRLVSSKGLDFPPARYALHAFGDPRIRLTFSDGRLALRVRGRRYDVIEADALEPDMAYSGNLYSREFFELAASALKPGGLFCTYTPTERTRRTVAAAFPWSLHFSGPGSDHSSAQWATLRFAIGSNQRLVFDRERVLARLTSEPLQRYWQAAGMEREVMQDVRGYLEQASVLELGPLDRERFARGDINTDLFPRDEYSAATAGQ